MTVLPADVYDTLELSAWEFGGIGALLTIDAIGHPVCAVGHAMWCDGGRPDAIDMQKALYEAIPSLASASDAAVRAVNMESGNALNARIPFSRWCARLNIVRGD